MENEKEDQIVEIERRQALPSPYSRTAIDYAGWTVPGESEGEAMAIEIFALSSIILGAQNYPTCPQSICKPCTTYFAAYSDAAKDSFDINDPNLIQDVEVLLGDFGHSQPRYTIEDDGYVLDARGAIFRTNIFFDESSFIDISIYGLIIDASGAEGVSLLGGLFLRDDPWDLSWSQSYGFDSGGPYHNTAVGVVDRRSSGSLIISNIKVFNHHDAVGLLQPADIDSIVFVKESSFVNVRDDVFENDNFHSMIIMRNYIDSAWTFYSGRGGKVGSTVSASELDSRLVLIDRNIARLTSMLHDGEYTHGRLFKMDPNGIGPSLIITNNIFFVEADIDPFKFIYEKIVYAENNVLVWLGNGPFTYQAPNGFKVVDMDSLEYSSFYQLVDPDGGLKFEEFPRMDSKDVHFGSSLHDSLLPTDSIAAIVAGDGNDIIFDSREGHVIYTGPGADIAFLGAGRDFIVSDRGGTDRFVIDAIDNQADHIFGISFADGDRIVIDPLRIDVTPLGHGGGELFYTYSDGEDLLLYFWNSISAEYVHAVTIHQIQYYSFDDLLEMGWVEFGSVYSNEYME